MQLPERLSGGVWGHLVGDALGVPYEFRRPRDVGEITWGASGTHGQPPGTWSDDGALMLALLDSLLARGFDTQDQGERALAWWREGRYAAGGVVFDIGGATSSALRRIEQGHPAARAGAPDALGNGSLMRILPLALVMRGTADHELADLAARASRVTHGSSEAALACALYALVVRLLLAGESKPAEALEGASAVLRAALPEGTEPADLDAFVGWTGRSGHGRVVDAFWSAWDAFSAATSYRDTVVRAVRCGNDTDTTAAIAGGLAGVHWGIDGIPAEWRDGLRERPLVQSLIDGLIETGGWRTSSGSPLRLDFLDLAGVDGFEAPDGRVGRVGLTLLPGKQRDGWSGRHWRDLEQDAARLRDHYGARVLVLFVEDEELERCRATRIGDVLAAHEIELIRFPIEDGHGLPEDREAYRALVTSMVAQARDGATIAVACRGGLDRTGTFAGCLLREAGAGPEEAVERVQRARRGALTRPAQQRFVREWASA